jgi:protein TonB
MTAAVVSDNRLGGSEFALWTVAGAVALAVHAGFAAWMLSRPTSAGIAPTQAAVMIEMAPVPTAPASEETQIAPDADDQREVLEAPDDTPDLPDIVDEAVAPVLEPPPEVPAPLEDVLPPVDMTPVDMAAVAVTRPRQRPEDLPRPPAPEKLVEKKAPPEKKPPQEQRTKAKAEAATQSDKIAAPRDSQASAGSTSQASWKSKLMARLERAKRYPAGAERRREEGVVYVSFKLDSGGRVLSAQIARSSGYAELDQEVLALVKRASPLPPPPPGVPGQVTAPVKFNVR